MSEMAGTETPETAPAFDLKGVIVIEWPPPEPGHPGQPIRGWKVAVFDALSGKPITTVSKIEIHVPANGLVIADLTMFASPSGPLFDGEPFVLDGKPLEATFPFLVAEMRIRPAEPDRGALAAKFLAEPCAS